MKEIIIDGVIYVPKETYTATNENGLEYVIVRAKSAGVFAGHLEAKEGDEVVLRNCRRLWYWSGAASCSQLANDGVSNPDKCKFPAAVNKIRILGVIEIIPTTEKAQKSIEGVTEWMA